MFHIISSKTWQPRKQGHSIIRLTYIPAVCSVVYTKDGTHYKDITTVDGTKQKPSRRYPLQICFYIIILGLLLNASLKVLIMSFARATF